MKFFINEYKMEKRLSNIETLLKDFEIWNLDNVSGFYEVDYFLIAFNKFNLFSVYNYNNQKERLIYFIAQITCLNFHNQELFYNNFSVLRDILNTRWNHDAQIKPSYTMLDLAVEYFIPPLVIYFLRNKADTSHIYDSHTMLYRAINCYKERFPNTRSTVISLLNNANAPNY